LIVLVLVSPRSQAYKEGFLYAQIKSGKGIR